MIALVRMTSGLTLWAVAFCVLYGLHGIGCASGWAAVPAGPVSLHRLILSVAWVGGVGAALLIALWLRRRGGEAMIDRAGRALAWVGLGATLVSGLPVATLPACV